MEERKAGVCGTNVTWEFHAESGKLVVSGVGPMAEYTPADPAPWFAWRKEIREIEVQSGVTSLSNYSFFKCAKAEKIVLPPTLDVCGFRCMGHCSALKEVEIPEGTRVLESRTLEFCTSLKKVRLPLSLKAIDMKCFPGCDSLEEVIYAGTKEQWDRIRLSMVGDGNTVFCNVPRTYEGKITAEENITQDDVIWHRERKEVIPVLDIAAEILKKGGDGRLHILAFEHRIDKLIHEKSGDATLIIFPDGQTMMIDVGVPSVEKAMLDQLRRVGVTSLDHFVASHYHHDHIGNAIPVAKYIYGEGGKIGTYHFIDLHDGKWEIPLSAYLREQGVKIETNTKAGDVFEIGGVKIEILGPHEEVVHSLAFEGTSGGVNNVSIIMKFIFGKSSYLTSGDLFRDWERKVVKEYGALLEADVMKANHHGIITSNSDEWIEAVSPKIVLAHHDDIGSTSNSEMIRARGSQYFTTGLNGSILVSLSADGDIEVKTAFGETWTK